MAFENPVIHWVARVTAEHDTPHSVELCFEQSDRRSLQRPPAKLDIYFDYPDDARRFAEAINSVNVKVEEDA